MSFQMPSLQKMPKRYTRSLASLSSSCYAETSRDHGTSHSGVPGTAQRLASAPAPPAPRAPPPETHRCSSLPTSPAPVNASSAGRRSAQRPRPLGESRKSKQSARCPKDRRLAEAARNDRNVGNLIHNERLHQVSIGRSQMYSSCLPLHSMLCTLSEIEAATMTHDFSHSLS